jgi:thioredoxin reductase (NADPH)
MIEVYDTIIIGGGPAGLSAALYASRAMLNTLVIEVGLYGGQMATTTEVDNYPGVAEGITGPELAMRMKEQAMGFGTKFIEDTVQEVSLLGKIKEVRGLEGKYLAKTVIIASGASPRLAGFKGEEDFRARGVSYCATCDGFFFRGKKVVVIGGGDSALQEAIFLTKFASQVTVIHRRDEFRASKSLVEKARKDEKIHFLLNSVVEEATGDEKIDTLRIRNVKENKLEEHHVDGCFVFVGLIPNSQMFKGILDMNENGQLITDVEMRTSIPGVFAAGDIREKSLRQVVTATADGAIAATNAETYISNNFNEGMK